MTYAVLISFSPGSNVMMSMSAAGKYGFRGGLRFCNGVFFGCIGVIGLCTLFGMTLSQYLPRMQSAMIRIGAAYILWLAVGVWIDRPQTKKRCSPRPDSLLTGALLQFINPHAVMYGLTAMSGFVLPYYAGAPGLLLLFVLVLAAIGWLGVVCWAVFGAVFHSFFATHQTLLNAVTSLLLGYVAISLLKTL